MADTQVNFNIDEDLWSQFRKGCIDSKVTASEAMRQLIREQLARWEEGKKRDTHE